MSNIKLTNKNPSKKYKILFKGYCNAFLLIYLNRIDNLEKVKGSICGRSFFMYAMISTHKTVFIVAKTLILFKGFCYV